jgi:beta-galactosidase
VTSSCVALKPGSIWINGEPVILVTSSLFYFRIPAAEWRSRMRTLRILGYNAIDVYFPWNYHELEPNHWDFSGERDVRAFLQQAREEGLWVVARPGPYICSEWDGGSLPAWLNVEPDMHLRDNDPRYLDAVRGWFDQIIPLVAEYQIDRGGTVVLVQLENELDFYNCTDRAGLMSALRDLVLARGIIVPLLACAGQGDIPGATGNIANVAPACNLYFDPRDPGVEQRVRHYDHLVRQRGYPLCVIDTNRSHTDLRRLMAGGAKLLGPYLQTGGTDFGFTTGVTNWGDPLSFMTSHYDFGGMISPGGKVRPEGRDAIILTKMLTALGSAMALSTPLPNSPVPVQGVEGQALALDGGGWLVGLLNVGEEVAQVTMGEDAAEFPVRTVLTVAPGTCPFVLLDYPLSRWGLDCRITY